MTVAYSINGGTEIHGVRSRWVRLPKRQQVDGSYVYSDWAINTWDIAEMPMATWEEIIALRGSALTTLETNDFALLNDSATYNTSNLFEIAGGVQEGLRATNITITFHVDTTSD